MTKTEHEAHRALVEAARALLEDAHRAWSAVAGQLHTFRDEDLLDEGRARHWQDIEPNETIDEEGEDVGEDSDEADYPQEEAYRFWATSSPWRLRLERFRQDPPPAAGDATAPHVTVIDGKTWWTLHGGEVETGGVMPDRLIVDRIRGTRWAVYGDEVVPDPDNWHYTPSSYELDRLLKPNRLARAFEYVDARQIESQRRRAIRLRAVPVPRPDFYVDADGFAALGCRDYAISVDAQLGIVLELEAYIDGRVALRYALSDLRTDTPIDMSIFDRPPG